MLNGSVMGWLGGLLGPRPASDDDTREAAGEATGGDDQPAPWITVLTAFDMVQARIAAARLDAEGIPVRVRQEGANAALPVGVGILGRIDLLVPEPKVEHALRVLDAVIIDDDPMDSGDYEEA